MVDGIVYRVERSPSGVRYRVTLTARQHTQFWSEVPHNTESKITHPLGRNFMSIILINIKIKSNIHKSIFSTPESESAVVQTPSDASVCLLWKDPDEAFPKAAIIVACGRSVCRSVGPLPARPGKIVRENRVKIAPGGLVSHHAC